MRQVFLLFTALAISMPNFAQNGAGIVARSKAFAVQLAPVPQDSAELVTGQTSLPASPQERAALVALVEKAVENHNLHLRHNPPYDLRISFTVAPSTLYQGGSGAMQETWVSGQNWRWAAAFGNYSNVQLSSNGAVYGQTRTPLPIHFKLLRDAIFAPVGALGWQAPIRWANASWQGGQVTCILRGSDNNDETPEQGRRWYQTEHCLNPQTGAIQIWSMAPGIYAVYNYANALSFHGHALPGSIAVTENGTTVAEAQLTSLTDADPSNLSLYTPTAQMQAQGPAPVGGMIQRLPLYEFDSQIPSGSVVQPTIVHVTLDQQGKVLEIEPLQTSGVSDRAMAAVKAMHFGFGQQPAQASPLLLEAFINVQFRPVPQPLRNSQ